MTTTRLTATPKAAQGRLSTVLMIAAGLAIVGVGAFLIQNSAPIIPFDFWSAIQRHGVAHWLMPRLVRVVGIGIALGGATLAYEGCVEAANTSKKKAS